MRTMKGTASDFRTRGWPSFIRNQCFMLDLKLDMEVDTGWLMEDVRFSVSGDDDALEKFIEKINEARGLTTP